MTFFLIVTLGTFFILWILLEMFRRKKSENWLESALQEMKKPDHRKSFSPLSIITEPDQFVIIQRGSNEKLEITWSEIIRMAVFKKDLITYDSICVIIFTSDGKGIEVSEEMDGFTELMEQVPNHCKGCPAFSDWYLKIMNPAFETNLTELYKK